MEKESREGLYFLRDLVRICLHSLSCLEKIKEDKLGEIVLAFLGWALRLSERVFGVGGHHPDPLKKRLSLLGLGISDLGE